MNSATPRGSFEKRRRLKKRTILILVLGLVSLAPLNAASSKNGSPAGHALLASLDGAIGPASADYIDQAVNRAEKNNARLMILKLDTPGGLSTAMRHIVKAILNASVPVVVYVAPSGARAASAGTYITYAAQVAAMAPATNIGAATPVSLGGNGDGNGKGSDKDHSSEDKSQPASSREAERRKVVNDAVAYIRTLAEKRGRNAGWAERAVRQGVSLTAKTALQKNVVDVIAPSPRVLLTKIDGRSVQVQGEKRVLQTKTLQITRFSPSWRIKLLSALSNPSLAYLLLMAGIIGLVIEGLSPGAALPGVVGAICLLLALFAFQLFPVNYTGLAFLALGVVLMIAEALVPSFGALGFGGVAAFLFGSVMLMDTNVPGFQISFGLIIGIAICAVVGLGGVVFLFWRSRREPIRTGDKAMIGARIEALDDFDGRGWVLAHGERWQARTRGRLRKGQAGRVRGKDGLILEVEPLPDDSETFHQDKHGKGVH